MNTKTRVAVIAGGSGYLGSALCSAFERAGWDVVVLSRSGASAVDITDSKSIEKALANVRAIDVCIHAAAPPLVRKPLLALSDVEFGEQVAVALYGAFALFKVTASRLVDGGAIVGITTSALEPGHGKEITGSYIAAKSGLRGLLRVLAAQLAPRIRVYAVAPGFLPGGLNADIPEAARNLLASKLATRTTPEEVASLVLEIAQGVTAIPTGSSILMPSRAVTPL